MKSPLALLIALAAGLSLLAGGVGALADGGPAKQIAMLGDSLGAGRGLPSGKAFPARLEEALREAGHDVDVVDMSVSGDTTAGGLARLEWLLDVRPDLVIVELGGNDALRGLPPKQTRANLDAILSRLAKADVTVLLAGMRAPRNLGREYYNKFDRIYPELAAKHDVAFYPFFLEGVAGNPELNQADGIHPNAEGVEEIVGRILPEVVRLLDESSGAARRSSLSYGIHSGTDVIRSEEFLRAHQC